MHSSFVSGLVKFQPTLTGISIFCFMLNQYNVAFTHFRRRASVILALTIRYNDRPLVALRRP